MALLDLYSEKVKRLDHRIKLSALPSLTPEQHDDDGTVKTKNLSVRPASEERQIPLSTLKGRLFDREQQKKQLINVYERILFSQGDDDDDDETAVREIAVVTGPSGTGKTVLAQSIQQRAIDDGCYFLYGKCDQIQRQEPFSPFIQAFTAFVETVLSKRADDNGEEFERVKRAIKEATKESDVEILTDMIPAFQKILREENAEKKDLRCPLDGEAMTRKKSRPNAESPSIALFCKFIEELCSKNSPLVLLIDDWQWLDPSSLMLLYAVSASRKVSGFMLMGTCRGNEVGVCDDLSYVLRSLEERSNVRITDVQVGNLGQMAVNEIVADLLGSEPMQVSSLALKVYELTHGNGFFVQQCLVTLHDQGLLYFENAKWCWEESSIDQSNLSKGYAMIPDFIIERASLTSPAVEGVLQVAACLGSRFSRQHVQLAVDSQGVEIDQAFLVLVQKGVVVKRQSRYIYKWSHDRFQHAAYTLIPEDKRAEYHVSIGRRLLHRLSESELLQNTLLVANLLLSDVSLLQDGKEKRDAAALFCAAGYRAAQSSAFEESAKYFRTGIDMLPPTQWEEMYSLTLRLYDGAAEMEFCLGHTKRVDDLAATVIKHARSMKDKIRAYETRILSLSARNDMHEGIRVGFELLRKVGEPLPNRTNLLRDLADLTQTRFMLRNKSADDILALPPLTMWSKLVVLRVLNLIFPAILRVRTDLSILFATRGVKITLRYGLSPMACPAFCFFGMLVCHPIGNIPEGTSYADIGSAIYDKFNPTDLRSRVLCVQSAFCRPWKESIRTCLPLRLSAASSGMLTGDIELAFLNHVIYYLEGFACGMELREHYDNLVEIKHRYDGLKQDTVMVYLLVLLQLGQNLLGAGQHSSVLRGDYFEFDEAKATKSGQVDQAEVAVYGFARLHLALFLGDYEVAAKAGDKLMRGILDGMSAFSVMSMTFMAGLAEVIHARETGKKASKAAGKSALKKLNTWARFSPENLFSRIYFIEAERFAMEGKRERAFRKYKLAIDQAGDQGFIHEQAFAYERAGISLREWKNDDEALNCFRQARSLYDAWGAPMKVAQMDARIAEAEASSGYF